MVQNRARLAGLALLAGLFTACTDGAIPTQVFEPSPSFAQSSNAPVHLVSGGGKADFSILGPPNGVETYGLNASVDGDGNAKGEFQATFSDPYPTFHADVTCLAVSGSDAWLGVIVTQTHDPVTWPVGTEGVIRVRDNGEGAKEPNDEIGYWVLGVEASSCIEMRTDDVFGDLFPWIHGNAQVK